MTVALSAPTAVQVPFLHSWPGARCARVCGSGRTVLPVPMRSRVDRTGDFAPASVSEVQEPELGQA